MAQLTKPVGRLAFRLSTARSKKRFCELGQRLKTSFDDYRSSQRRKNPLEKRGQRCLGCEGACLCIRRCWMRLWKCRLRSVEVTSALISASDLQLSFRSQRHKCRSPGNTEQTSQVGLDLGSKPCEHFPHGSVTKGESKTPQAGGHHKSLGLGQGPKEASPTWKMLSKNTTGCTGSQKPLYFAFQNNILLHWMLPQDLVGAV